MSATAPSDEAWAALCAQVNEMRQQIVNNLNPTIHAMKTQITDLQTKHASIESRLEVVETRITALEQEPTYDPADLTELADEVRALRQYVATRDDISEMRLM